MRSIRYVATFMLLSGVILMRTAPVQADPPQCDLWCNSQIACDFFCIDSEGRNSTCGQAGYSCDPCGQPQWVETGRQAIGRWDKNWPGYCENWEDQLIYETDATGCYGNRTRCDPRMIGHGWNIDCCEAWGCWGGRCS